MRLRIMFRVVMTAALAAAMYGYGYTQATVQTHHPHYVATMQCASEDSCAYRYDGLLKTGYLVHVVP